MKHKGFSLFELICVMAVISIMASVVIPMANSGNYDNMRVVEAQTHAFLDGARQFAVANRTYVRVGFVEATNSAGVTSVVAQCLHSTSGNLRYDTVDGFADASKWRSTDKPIVLSGVKLDDTLVARLPEAAGLVSALEAKFTPFRRLFQGKEIEFRYIIQFDPQGQFSIEPDKAVRSAVIGFRNPRRVSDPVGLLLTGSSGRIQTFRQDNLN